MTVKESPQIHEKGNYWNLNNSFIFDGKALKFGPHVDFYSSYTVTNFHEMSKSRTKACYIECCWIQNLSTWDQWQIPR